MKKPTKEDVCYALLCMVYQYMDKCGNNEFDTLCMCAGEEAGEALDDMGYADYNGRTIVINDKGQELYNSR